MWDKPHLLRMMTIALFGISMVLLAYSLVHYALQLPIFRLRTVQLTHVPQQVDVNQLNQVVRRVVSGSFFTVDLEKTRRSFEQLPWVRKVSVRRHFPWGLEVTLEEHMPLARWNSAALVNTYGEVFAGQSKLPLPDFNGEPDTSKQVAEMYVALSAQLAALQRSISEINLSPRFAWQLRLDNGMQLELGREQVQQRMARFVAVYPYSFATMERKVNYTDLKHVDLRYRNGFAASQLSGRLAGMKNESGHNSAGRV
jgi:cell division protein FtsQ